MEKLFQTLFARNYYFNAIINSIIFPARVEIHETRFVAGTFTQPSERPVIFKKTKSFSLFPNFFPNFFPKLRSTKYAAFCQVCSISPRLHRILLVLGSLVVRLLLALATARAMPRVLRSPACGAMLNGKNVSYALCLYLGLGTARSSARRIPFKVIAGARVELLHLLLVSL